MPGFRCRNEGFDSLTPERSRRLAAPPRGDRRSDKPEEVGGDVGLASRLGEENAIARKDEITNRPGELVEVDLRRYGQNCLVCQRRLPSSARFQVRPLRRRAACSEICLSRVAAFHGQLSAFFIS